MTTTRQRAQHIIDKIKFIDAEKKEWRDLIFTMDGYQSIEDNSCGVKNIYCICDIIDINVKRHAQLQNKFQINTLGSTTGTAGLWEFINREGLHEQP